MGIDKTVRWENVDLAKAGHSIGELNAVRLKQAIKRVNVLLNAPKPKKPKMKLGGLPPENGWVGRFGGGMGTDSFVRGGSPGSKR